MHTSVLLNETIQFLNIRPSGRYVDGTLGFGGHAEAIAQRLSHDGRLLALDVDSQNMAAAQRRLQPFGEIVQFVNLNFRRLPEAMAQVGWVDVDGFIFDLGVASPHFDDAERGFSFQQEGPLDMRLDPSQKETALSVLLKMDEKKLEQILSEYGETQNAKRLSRSILFEAGAGRLKTTKDLANVCERAVGRRGKTHPATRVFLALRCVVNDEMGALQEMLASAPNYLKVGGRLSVISFHSGEDRMVKERFRTLASDSESQFQFSILTKKPVVPTDVEQQQNPRSRSAKLRVLERVA